MEKINAYALNLSAEEALAPRLSVVGQILSRIGNAVIPSHVLAATSIDLAADEAGGAVARG